MHQPTVLIVDDEEKIRELLEIRLTSEGFKVILAADGAEGVMQARKYKPDCILMDVMMPNMDGADAVKLIEEDPDTKDIPVMFLTSMITKEEETKQAFGIHLDAKRHKFIAKPFETQSLIEEIRKAIDGR